MSDFHDLAAIEDLLKNMTWYSQTFILYPTKLAALSLPTSLTWQSIQFNPANKGAVSNKRGVYAFVVRHDDSNLPPHGYITYVGITGHSSARTLQARYEDYLREQRRPKRLAIHQMLVKWRDCIHFYYAEIDDTLIDLSAIEKGLNSAIIPPFSSNDFDVDVRQAKGAWEKF